MEQNADTSGFYRAEINEDSTVELIHAPNFVYSKDYTLLRENKDGYEYPVYGWRWFNSVEAAKQFYGIVDPEE